MDAHVLRWCGFFSQRGMCSRSSREPNLSLQNGHGRNVRGRPPARPATRLCAALIHSSESARLQCGHRSPRPADGGGPPRGLAAVRGIKHEASSTRITPFRERRRARTARRSGVPSSLQSETRISWDRLPPWAFHVYSNTNLGFVEDSGGHVFATREQPCGSPDEKENQQALSKVMRADPQPGAE